MANNSSYALRCSIHGHSEDVRALKPTDVPENGIVSGSRDKTIKVWKPSENGMEYLEAHCMLGPTHYISSLCTLPPSTQYPSGLILAGSNDCAIYGFSLETSQPMLKLLGHSNTVCTLAAGNFGTVVSGSWDKSARVWLGQKCVMTLEGHQAAVWAVAMFRDLGLTLTASADKTIRLWRTGNCEKIFRGHEDCVRGLAILSGLEFLSCSNDATVRMWQTNGDCIHVFSGHENYIYCISIINEAGDFVTCSEDRTVKIWKSGACVQTIKFPSKTLWSLACLKNEDIAVGGSDGSIRIFTKHKELMAAEQETKEFENEVLASDNVKDSIGDLKLDDVPDLSALTTPGKEDGQTIMCREGSEVFVYQWNAAVANWTKVGSVCDANENKKKTFEGKEYDYIFNIDVEDGKYLKLPYNKGENPWMIAQRFIEKHNLSQVFLDQIAHFIFANTETNYEPMVDAAGPSDPFTGGSRYIPSSNSQSGYDQPAIHGDRICANMYYPIHRYLRFDSANLGGLEKKLTEFNEQVSLSERITPEDLKDVMLLADTATIVTEQQMSTLDKVMNWPPEWVFPSLDLFRIAMKNESVCEKVGEDDGLAVANYLMDHVERKDQHANQMLALRTLCNFFGQSTGEKILVRHFEKFCLSARNCIPCINKNVQTAVATLYLNYTVALNKSIISDAPLLTYNSMKIFKDMTDQEALFRMLVCFGSLLENEEARAIIRSSDIAAQLANLAHSEFANKVRECSKILLENLC